MPEFTKPNGPTFKQLGPDDLTRIGEVDRSEVVEAEYLATSSDAGRSLTLERVELNPSLAIRAWTQRGIDVRIEEWKPHIEAGGYFLGALLGPELIGFAILGPRRQGSAELCALFVDSAHRRSGVGGQLMDRIEQVARQRGVESIWLGSNRTASAVEFYLKHGYKAISLNRNDLVEHRLGDPVFARAL